MSGSAPTNNTAVQFEQQQAAEADQKEAARQASLQQGQTLIDQIFNGSPVMKDTTSNFDWSTFGGGASPLAKPTNTPAGYTAVWNPGKTTTTTAAPLSSGNNTGFTQQYAQPAGVTDARGHALGTTGNTPTSGGPGDGGGATTAGSWGLKDASGKMYSSGDPLSITTSTDTGQKTGGFDDDFYNNYRQKVLDYYNPDEAKQYSEAQRDLTYNLARAGTLQSSTAADKQGDLAYNDALQKANIVANANSQTGQLQSQIQANKESLINQLYATDDPTLTANLAESSARASQLQDPTLTPMASLFTPALTAVGSVANSYLSPYSTVAQGAGGSSGVSSPAPASSSYSSGKVVYG